MDERHDRHRERERCERNQRRACQGEWDRDCDHPRGPYLPAAAKRLGARARAPVDLRELRQDLDLTQAGPGTRVRLLAVFHSAHEQFRKARNGPREQAT